eukprot:COSAG02_NODE_3207_length_7169_cov_2.626874_1_plen_392_part_00
MWLVRERWHAERWRVSLRKEALAMPLFGRSTETDTALLALEAYEHGATPEKPQRQRSVTLTPDVRVTKDLKQQHRLRSSMHLVPEAHVENTSNALERTTSAKAVADKLSSKKRRKWMTQHQDAIDEGSPRGATDDQAESGKITPVPDLHRLSIKSFAVAAAPTPSEFADLSPRQLREQQHDAALAGMTRSRTVYFRSKSLDWLFFLRNEHPLLSCVVSHPLHPFGKEAHAQFLGVIVLFGIFTSVITLHNVCKDQSQGQVCERKLDNELYQIEIIKWALASALLQMLMQTLAVCPCLQPGGVCECMCTQGCTVCCTKIGHEGLVVIACGIGLLTFVSILIAVNDDRIDTLNVLKTAIEVKIRAFGISFILLTLKFFFFVSNSSASFPGVKR